MPDLFRAWKRIRIKRDWRRRQKRQRPQRGGRYPFNRRLIRDQPM
jgi:hypothetical protein